eukprot:TRINITY_DN6814_c0_g1_i1.p1 TRINITY_DN6814_c0_g1~~TRINITY_DN6814_c0_g1_i1.p1  ORF type:complete len:374 (+),score=101.25 TRINITY_DN6814_c0_g1_i1:146-1267(+)
MLDDCKSNEWNSSFSSLSSSQASTKLSNDSSPLTCASTVEDNQRIVGDYVRNLRKHSNGTAVLQAKVVLLGSSNVGKSSIVRRYMFKEFLDSLPATVGAAFHTKVHSLSISVNDNYQHQHKKIPSANNLASLESTLSTSSPPSSSLLSFFKSSDVTGFVNNQDSTSSAQNNNNGGYLGFRSASAGNSAGSITAEITLNLWDTAGQERFRSMGPMYYKGSDTAVLVFDLSSSESFSKVHGWVDELKANVEVDNGVTLILVANKSDHIFPDSTQHSFFKSSASSAALLENKLYQKAKGYSESIGAKLFVTSAKSGAGIDDLFNYITIDCCVKQLNKDVVAYLIDRADPDNNRRTSRDSIISLGTPKSRVRCCQSS